MTQPPMTTNAITLRSSSNVALAGAQLIASRRSPRTRDAYTRDLDAWLVFCDSRGFNPDEALLPHAVLYRDSLERACAPATVARRLASLSLIYGGLMSSGIVPRNPFDGRLLPRPEVSKIGSTPLARNDDVERVLAALEGDVSWTGLRDHALIRLLWDTGIRRESAVELRRENVDLRNASARVRVKGGRLEPITLPEESCEALRRWLLCSARTDSSWVFPGVGAKHLALTLVNRIFNRRCANAGVSPITPHQFRATFVTEALDAGVPLHEVQGAVHHRSVDTTKRYDRHARGTAVADTVSQRRRKKP